MRKEINSSGYLSDEVFEKIKEASICKADRLVTGVIVFLAETFLLKITAFIFFYVHTTL